MPASRKVPRRPRNGVINSPTGPTGARVPTSVNWALPRSLSCRRSGLAQVEVGDTGNGMSQEYVQTRLFKPFETTKPAGMGIGAYESFQYVRELGGSISVDTELERGTVMTIALPLFEPRQASGLQMSSAK